MRRTLWIPATGALLLTLAACGDSAADDAADAATSEAGGAAAEELTPLRISLLAIADYAPAFYAVDHGYFVDEGLDVDLVVVDGGAASVPALMSGDTQIAATGWSNYIQALAQGLPLRAVLPGAQAVDDFAAIVTVPGAGVVELADLEGRSIAVNTLSGVAAITTVLLLEEAGLDPDQVEFVELPPPDTMAALANGHVDAAWTTEPFLTLWEQDDVTIVADVYASSLSGKPLGGWVTSEEFIDAEPEVLDAFARAMARAIADLSDEATFRDFLPEFSELPPHAVEAVTLPIFQDELDPEALQDLVEDMVSVGVVEESFDVSATLGGLRDATVEVAE